MLKPKKVTVDDLRRYFGKTRWEKFTASVDAGEPLDVLGVILFRKSIARYCRNIYLEKRGKDA